MPRPPKDLTVGQIARLFGVASRTVAKWIDGGLLTGAYLLPATGRAGRYRRVPPAALVKFCRAHGLPCPAAPWWEESQ